MPLHKSAPGAMPGMLARFTRSAAAASAAWAIALAALVAGVAGVGGAASAYAATPGAAPAAGVTWHRLSLLNNWAPNAAPGTGYPSWAVKGGVVYLSGSIHQVSGNIVGFALLPPAARPARLVIVPVYTSGDTHGWLEIYPSGNIYADSNPYSDAQSYTSLAGVSFPAAGLTRHSLTLLNGWNRSRGYWDGPPSYSVSGGMVYLSGALKQSSGPSETFAVLPKGARPARVEYITVATWNGVRGSGTGTGVVRIYPSGRMDSYGAAQHLIWLGAVSFPQAGTTSHKLTLVNGWTSGQSRYSTGDPAYTVAGGVVHLSGSLIQHGAGPAAFATLPPGARPKHSLYISVYTYDGSVGTVFIQPNGLMQAYSPSPLDAAAYTSLAAISFPVGS